MNQQVYHTERRLPIEDDVVLGRPWISSLSTLDVCSVAFCLHDGELSCSKVDNADGSQSLRSTSLDDTGRYTEWTVCCGGIPLIRDRGYCTTDYDVWVDPEC